MKIYHLRLIFPQGRFLKSLCRMQCSNRPRMAITWKLAQICFFSNLAERMDAACYIHEYYYKMREPDLLALSYIPVADGCLYRRHHPSEDYTTAPTCQGLSQGIPQLSSHLHKRVLLGCSVRRRE